MCGHRQRSQVRYVADDEGLRASQAERDRVVDVLRDHAAEGRLDFDELEERIDAALRARSRGDLRGLVADLPAPPRRGSSGPARPAIAAGSLILAILPLAAAVLLLALAPPAIAWVGWALLGWWIFTGLPGAGVGFASCGQSRHRRRRTAVV